MANLTFQSMGYAGTDVTFTALTGGAFGDAVLGGDSRGFLWVKNTAAGGSVTVTIHTPGSTFGINYPDIAVVVADGEERMIGPLVNELTDPAFLGAIAMTISGTMTGVTGAAVRVPG